MLWLRKICKIRDHEAARNQPYRNTKETWSQLLLLLFFKICVCVCVIAFNTKSQKKIFSENKKANSKQVSLEKTE